jgi:hypothetical protein
MVNIYTNVNKTYSYLSSELPEHKKGTTTYDVRNPGTGTKM